MIKLYRWHVSKFYRPTEIKSLDDLKDISTPTGLAKKLHVVIDNSNILTSDDIEIKRGVEIFIAHHTIQNNTYLVLNNTRYEDTAVFAEIKGSVNTELYITVNPAISRTLLDFGEAIALNLTEFSKLDIALIENNVEINVQVNDWSSPPIVIPMEDLQDFFDEVEIPDDEIDMMDD